MADQFYAAKRRREDDTSHLPSELFSDGAIKTLKEHYPTTIGSSLRYPIISIGPYSHTIGGDNNIIELHYAGDSGLVIPNVQFSVEISERDQLFFKEHGAVLIYLYTERGGGKTGHLLTLIRSPYSNQCCIFDPNGNVHNTYSNAILGSPESILAVSLQKAVREGLLLGLDLDTPLQCDFSENDAPLQMFEENSAQFARIAFKHPYFQEVNDIVSYTCGGFCQTWTVFRLIDYKLTGGKLYEFISSHKWEEHAETNDMVFLVTGKLRPTDIQPIGTPDNFISTFSRCAWLPVLLRLIAVHLIDIAYFLQESVNPDASSVLTSLERKSLFDDENLETIRNMWKGMIHDPRTILEHLGNEVVLSNALGKETQMTGFKSLLRDEMMTCIQGRMHTFTLSFFPNFPFRYNAASIEEPNTRTYYTMDRSEPLSLPPLNL